MRPPAISAFDVPFSASDERFLTQSDRLQVKPPLATAMKLSNLQGSARKEVNRLAPLHVSLSLSVSDCDLNCAGTLCGEHQNRMHRRSKVSVACQTDESELYASLGAANCSKANSESSPRKDGECRSVHCSLIRPGSGECRRYYSAAIYSLLALFNDCA